MPYTMQDFLREYEQKLARRVGDDPALREVALQRMTPQEIEEYLERRKKEIASQKRKKKK
jgi:hypothetical protein